MWLTETIPDSDYLYYRVKSKDIDDKQKAVPNAFYDKQGGMSCNWSKYSTPNDTINSYDPHKFGVVKMLVENVRQIPLQEVMHKPTQNRAHSEVIGPKESTEIRLKFYDCASLVISPTE